MARFLINRKKSSGKIPGELVHLGTKKIDIPLIRFINFSTEKCIEKEPSSLEECLPYFSKKTVSWISLYGLHDGDLIQKLGDLFEIHPLLLEDMLNTDQRPKIAETDKYQIIILKLLDYNERTKTLSSDQMTLILDDDFLITLQEKEGHYFDSIRDRIRKGTGRVRRKEADYLTYVLLDTIIDNYLLIIETLGDTIEKTEERIFLPNQRDLIKEIYKHKTEINFLRKTVRPVREIVHQLIENESGFISDDDLKYFRDLNDLVIQATETIEIYQTMLNDQINIYHATLDNRANETMKVLTVLSAFFIPITFIAGVYGMNFDIFPELHLKYGYLFFWMLIVLITTSLFIIFKKKKWF
jgi:magnesium transporter